MFIPFVSKAVRPSANEFWQRQYIMLNMISDQRSPAQLAGNRSFLQGTAGAVVKYGLNLSTMLL